jgi:hypothetical protein
MKRLSIKNIEFSERLSEETNAFAADVYLDNKKFAYAKNDGRGGCTDIRHYPEKEELYKEAVEYAKNLPPQSGQFGELSMDLEFAIDILLDEWIKTKDMKKGILFKTPTGVTMILKFNRALSTVLKTDEGIKAVQKEVNKLKEEGNEILNTNLGMIEV